MLKFWKILEFFRRIVIVQGLKLFESLVEGGREREKKRENFKEEKTILYEQQNTDNDVNTYVSTEVLHHSMFHSQHKSKQQEKRAHILESRHS